MKSLPLIHVTSQKIIVLLRKASLKKNPAKFLYKENARTPLFMLESLLRILSKSGETEFLKALKHIKKLEDMLGAIEDYDNNYKLFSKNARVEKKQADYFLKKRIKEEKMMNAKLIKKEYYKETFQMLSAIIANFNEKTIISRIRKEIEEEINVAYDFYIRYPRRFESMEDQVHELRRKLRWLSIYGQSLDGIIVLEEQKKKKYAWEKKLITKQEQHSPFNKLPVRTNLVDHIHLNKKAFLATGYVITELGKIKDQGLQMEALAKSIHKTGHVEKEEALTLAKEKLNENYTEENLLKQAHKLLHEFFVTYGLHALLLLQ